MNVLELVESWLRQNGFDGLYEPDAVCACKVGHLAPCGDLGQHCIPGHVAPCPPECGEGCEFHIAYADTVAQQRAANYKALYGVTTMDKIPRSQEEEER